MDSRDIEVRKVAISFITEVIDESMKRFNLDFEAVDSVLTKLDYWRIFNDNEITCAGAHSGVEPVLQEIEEFLNEVIK